MATSNQVTFQDNRVVAAITTRAADILDGMTRDELIMRGFTNEETSGDAKPTPASAREYVIRLNKTVVFPTLMAASEGSLVVDGAEVKIPLDDYNDFVRLRLPEPLVRDWLSKVYEVNPHWRIEIPDEEAETDQKKA